jgi:hypothetical protein
VRKVHPSTPQSPQQSLVLNNLESKLLWSVIAAVHPACEHI